MKICIDFLLTFEHAKLNDTYLVLKKRKIKNNEDFIMHKKIENNKMVKKYMTFYIIVNIN